MVEKVGCTRCGIDNPADARFCIDCGASLAPATTGPTSRLAGRACPSCHTNNLENARFCAVCGQGLGDESAPVRPTPTRLEPQQPYARANARQRQGDKAMYCPVCSEITLVMADRQGIEVDYCPQCRGVWLDRGELDKIIERVALAQGGATPYTAPQRDRGSAEYREPRDYDDDYRRKKKRRHLLDDLFDFD
jgi:uncharacterized protein